MRAINYYLVVEKIKQEPKKVAGLIISDKIDEDNRYLKAKIISTGNLVEGVKDGDVIHYDRHAGHNINWKDKLYTVITAKDIVLVE
jgi:co-chaperonin GroES (HSP10)|tara:strand:- start:212 stop:469 length:258 start_codon:yes stop_codon:yes gene_type:complete